MGGTEAAPEAQAPLTARLVDAVRLNCALSTWGSVGWHTQMYKQKRRCVLM